MGHGQPEWVCLWELVNLSVPVAEVVYVLRNSGRCQLHPLNATCVVDPEAELCLVKC